MRSSRYLLWRARDMAVIKALCTSHLNDHSVHFENSLSHHNATGVTEDVTLAVAESLLRFGYGLPDVVHWRSGTERVY
ncbi:hypothetical protein CVS40_11014 [Lucilia cuprina]|nr:hypothetical protein CVS40_11014 [Lucilia cuprina]